MSDDGGLSLVRTGHESSTATSQAEMKVIHLPRLLIIKNEPSPISLLCQRFEASGYEVLIARTGIEGQSLCFSSSPDVVMLDLTLPDMDGIQVLKNLRRKAVSVPVMILTERGEIDHRVSALLEGADDYVMKPFKFSELLERIATLEKRRSFASIAVLKCDDIVIDLIARKVSVNGEHIPIRTRKFAVLTYLVKHQGEVVSREELAREIWQDESVTTKNVIEVQINRLRTIFANAGHPLRLQTVRGQGYVIGEYRSN